MDTLPTAGSRGLRFSNHGAAIRRPSVHLSFTIPVVFALPLFFATTPVFRQALDRRLFALTLPA
jgi:hypothetical protein